jgi:addiction module HigA family antidote
LTQSSSAHKFSRELQIKFKNRGLDRLEIDARFTGGFGPDVVKAFRRRIQAIRAALDERDLVSVRGNNFEKLKGDRSHQYSMRLNDQWRLILEIRKSTPKNILSSLSTSKITTEFMKPRTPAEAFPPGDYIREELAARGWTQADLAKIIGRSQPAVNEMINGKRGITPESALALSAAFGTSPEFWMNLETIFALSRAEADVKAIQKRAQKISVRPRRSLAEVN